MGCSSSKPVEVIEPTTSVPSSYPSSPGILPTNKENNNPLPPSTPNKPKGEEDMNNNQAKASTPSVKENTVSSESLPSLQRSAEEPPTTTINVVSTSSSSPPNTTEAVVSGVPETVNSLPTKESVPVSVKSNDNKEESVIEAVPVISVTKEKEESSVPVAPPPTTIPTTEISNDTTMKNEPVPVVTTTVAAPNPTPTVEDEIPAATLPVISTPANVVKEEVIRSNDEIILTPNEPLLVVVEPTTTETTSSVVLPTIEPTVEPSVQPTIQPDTQPTIEPLAVSNIGDVSVSNTVSANPPPPPPPPGPPPPPHSPPVAIPPPPPKRGPGTMSPETRKKAISGLTRAAAVTKALGNLTTAAMKAVDRSHVISMVTVKRLLRGDKTIVESILQQINTNHQLSYKSTDILVSLPMYVVSIIVGSAFKHLLTELHTLEKNGTSSFDATLPKALQSLRARFSEPQHIKDLVRAGDAATLLAYLNIFPMPENLTNESTSISSVNEDNLNSTVTAFTVSLAKRQLESTPLQTILDYATFRHALLTTVIGAGTFFQKYIVEPAMPADTVANQIEILRRTVYNTANVTVTEKESTVQDTYTAAESTLHYIMRGFDVKECPHIAMSQERMTDSIKILQANFTEAQTQLLKEASEKVANVWSKGMEKIANTIINDIQNIDTKAPNASKLLNEISDDAKLKLEDYFTSLTSPPKFSSAPTPVRNEATSTSGSVEMTDKELYDSIPFAEMNTLKTLARMKKDDIAWASVMQAARICADLIHDEEVVNAPKSSSNSTSGKAKGKGDKKGGGKK